MNRGLFLLVAALVLTTVSATAQTEKRQRIRSDASLRATGVSYTALDYSTLIPTNNSVVSGSLNTTNNIVLLDGSDIVGCGYSFQATAGKTYQITATYNTTQIFNGYGRIYVLNSLTGYFGNDVSKNFSSYGWGDNQLIVSGRYTATASKNVNLLIGSSDMVSLNYQIKIEELDATDYTVLDYSTILSVDNTPATGTLSEANNLIFTPYGDYATGKGYTFPTQAGKVYKVTCTYQAANSIWFASGFNLLTGGIFEGNSYNDIIHSNVCYNNGSECTITDYFAPTNSGNIRLLLVDYMLENLSYTIKIEEFPAPVIYTELDYSTALLVGNAPTTGTLSESTDAVIDPSYNYTTGKGYSFAAQAGKSYIITCNYFTPENKYLDAKFMLLTGDEFIGKYWSDVISSSMWGGGTLTYTATKDENIRILVVGDYNLTDLMYSIEIKEFTFFTLPELLNTTTNAITYSNNMQFTDNGVTTTLVAGNYDPPFRSSYENFYAVAYKITLATGNNIKIHSSKENDSYLYVYKADGIGGYTLVNYNDDGGGGSDSYLNITATGSGDYYIVVTDFFADSAGRYYLSVWNTATEPANSYPDKIAITAMTSSSQNITVNDNATEEEIRLALLSLVISGITDSDPVNLLNNPYVWKIASDGLSATYMPVEAPNGYVFDSNLQPATVTIQYSTGINDVQANLATIFSRDKNIVVCNAQTGSNLLVADITGRIVINTIINSSEMSIPVANNGMYIVRVGTQVAKVICK